MESLRLAYLHRSVYPPRQTQTEPETFGLLKYADAVVDVLSLDNYRTASCPNRSFQAVAPMAPILIS